MKLRSKRIVGHESPEERFKKLKFHSLDENEGQVLANEPKERIQSIRELQQLLAEEVKHDDLIAAIHALRDIIRAVNRLDDHHSSSASASSFSTQSFQKSKFFQLLKGVQDSEMPKKTMELLSKGLNRVGKSNFILVGCLFVGYIIDLALQTAQNMNDCSAFLKTMEKLLDIIIELLEPMHGNLLSDSHLQDAMKIVSDCVLVCCRYEKANFIKKFFKADSMKKELESMDHRILNLMQRMQLAVLGGVAKGVEKSHAHVFNPDSDGLLEREPVGIEERVEAVKQLLSIHGSKEGVAVVLYGHEGMGKSTLANKLIQTLDPEKHGYNLCRIIFDSSTHGDSSHIREFQSQIIEKFTGRKVSLYNLEDGRIAVKEALENCGGSPLLFIDNIVAKNCISQLLPGGRLRMDNRKLRIIVTSRELDVYRELPLNPKTVHKYPVKELSGDASEKVLRNQIMEYDAKECFDGEGECVREVASKCKGVPLLLSVFGRHLRFNRNCREDYEEVLQCLRFDKAVNSDAHATKALTSVPRSLSDECQQAFRFISVFLHQWDFNVVRILLGESVLDELRMRLMFDVWKGGLSCYERDREGRGPCT